MKPLSKPQLNPVKDLTPLIRNYLILNFSVKKDQENSQTKTNGSGNSSNSSNSKFFNYKF